MALWCDFVRLLFLFWVLLLKYFVGHQEQVKQRSCYSKPIVSLELKLETYIL